MDNEHCMLLALPCGRDHMDVLQQSNNLQTGFITYLQQKQAAGIVNIAAPGSQQVNVPSFFILKCAFLICCRKCYSDFECCLLPASLWCLAWLILWPSRWGQHIRLKHWSTFNILHSVLSQKIELFITTAVGTTYPTY